jgi:hypothetical protein
MSMTHRRTLQGPTREEGAHAYKVSTCASTMRCTDRFSLDAARLLAPPRTRVRPLVIGVERVRRHRGEGDCYYREYCYRRECHRAAHRRSRSRSALDASSASPLQTMRTPPTSSRHRTRRAHTMRTLICTHPAHSLALTHSTVHRVSRSSYCDSALPHTASRYHDDEQRMRRARERCVDAASALMASNRIRNV